MRARNPLHPCLRAARRPARSAPSRRPRASPDRAPPLPGLADANAAYSLGCVWLVSLTDLSGVGPALLSADNVPLALAALQWSAFLAPTACYASLAGYDLRRTFALQPAPPALCLACAAGGAALWALLRVARGEPPDSAEAAFRVLEAASPIWTVPATAADWASLLVLGALSPAVCEELLFSGFLFSALRRARQPPKPGLGAVDAAALTAALFGAFHLSPTQFAPTAVLGLAAAAARLAGGSVLPAIAVHAGHNAAAMVAGAIAASGRAPGGLGWAEEAAAAGVCVAAASVCWPGLRAAMEDRE